MVTMAQTVAMAAPAALGVMWAARRRMRVFRRTPMERPRIASRSEWLAARKELLTLEKAATRERDALAAARRTLPMVPLETTYVFDGPEGSVSLRDLFGDRSQLIVYHFMFDPAWDEGCKSCSFLADSIAGSVVHLPARDTAFAAISRAPIAKLEAFKRRMGWTFPWVSSHGNGFNADFSVTVDVDAVEGSGEYNYQPARTQFEARRIWFPKGELPGLSVFLRDGDTIFHTYSTYQRGLDVFLNTYNLLDVTPLGRQEEDGRIMAWIKHHDRYTTPGGRQ
jgi:predicted dithiol-disulfide oxidoreductase (DUF899 family)